ncbi:MAG: hypothetical protein CMJ83_18000 [Planctomycetes bacterium]|nr:hypothetical protein [Planctomycetota bacterium]
MIQKLTQIAPFLLLLSGGIVLMDDGGADAYPTSTVLVTSEAADAAVARTEAATDPAALEERDASEIAPLESDRYREKPLADPAPDLPVTPREDQAVAPVAFVGGKVLDLRKQPLKIAGFRAFPAGGEARAWRERLDSLEDGAVEMNGDVFRLPLFEDTEHHVAVRTEDGRWFLIESVRAGSENLVINLPVETKKAKARVTNKKTQWSWARSNKLGSRVVFSNFILTGPRPADARLVGNSAVPFGPLGVITPGEPDRTLSIKLDLTPTTHNPTNAPQNGVPTNKINRNLVYVKQVANAAKTHSNSRQNFQFVTWGNPMPNKHNFKQTKAQTLSWTYDNVAHNPVNVNPTVNPSGGHAYTWFVNGTNINGIGGSGIVDINGRSLANDQTKVVEQPPARDPACLPTRAWDDENGDEFYCWELNPGK